MIGNLLDSLVPIGAVFLRCHLLTFTLCLTGLLIEKALRSGNPFIRSALLRSTLLLTFALPMAGVIWNRLPVHPVGPVNLSSPGSRPGTSALAGTFEADWSHVAVWRPLISGVENIPEQVLPVSNHEVPWGNILNLSALGFSSLISVGLLFRFGQALSSCAALRRRGKAAAPAEEAAWRRNAAAMGVQMPQLLRVHGLESPILIGFFKPAILLPENLLVRDEIPSHELTHLRRHDMGWHLLANWALILMPLQPGFWLLKKALERADEDACDDAVLMRGANGAAYAKLLVQVAESQTGPNPGLCMPMAAFRSQLERRLHRLLNNTRPLAERLSVSVLCLGLAPLLAVGLLGGAIFIDTERPAAAADATSAQNGIESKTDPKVEDADSSDLKTWESRLLDAKEDAAKRRVLYESTSKMNDTEFANTLIGMGRAPEAMTSLQNKILDLQGGRQSLLKQGYDTNHPRIQAVDAQLSKDAGQYAALLAGAHSALKIDSQMADARIKVLQDRVQEVKAARPLPGNHVQASPVQTDNMSFLGHMTFYTEATPEEKEALTSALKSVDLWHGRLDQGQYSDIPAPDYLNDQPVTAWAWQQYLASDYSRYGQPLVRTLKTMVRGGTPSRDPKITFLTVGYETHFAGPNGGTTLGENLQLHRGDDGQWRVARFVTYTPTDPNANLTLAASPPPIRSIDVEFVGGPSIPINEMKARIIAASGFQIGSPCLVGQLHRATRQIYATGQVALLVLDAQPIRVGDTITGITVHIAVMPNPVVKTIGFEGVDAAEQAKLAPLLRSKKGVMTSEYLVFEDAQTITSELAKEGLHLGATGAATMREDPSVNSAAVTFKIRPL